MPSENELPRDLVSTARSLEERFQALHIPNYKIPLRDWDSVPSTARGFIPNWLRNLLAIHSLAGPVLERPHEHGEWERYFSFWTPSIYAKRVTPDDPVLSRNNGWWLTETIIKDGFLPLSDESDGDLWIISITGGPTAPVYLFDLSGRKRKLAGESVAKFLATFTVSEDEAAEEPR